MVETRVADVSWDAPGERGAALRIVFADEKERSGRVERLDAEGRATRGFDIAALTRSVPCFTPGTRIATPKGEVPAEKVRPGDRLITRDNGAQIVLACGRVHYGWRSLGLNPFLRPVRIAAGAFGGGLPERDLTVSPSHRMLLRQGSSEVLVAAGDLAGRPGIEHRAPIEVTYLQILLPRHEAVLSDGAWSESFEAAPDDIAALSDRAETDSLRPAAGGGALEPVPR